MNKVVIVLFAASVALGATTLHLVRELREERAAARALEARIAELERAQARSEPALAQTPFTLPPVESPYSSAPANEPANAAAPPAPPVARASIAASGSPVTITKEDRMRMMREGVERQRSLLRDPEYREAMRLQQKVMLPQMYPDLATELDMTPEQTDALMSLLADQQIRAMERDRPFIEGPPDPATMQEIVRNQQEHQAEMDNEVRQLLGEDKWRAWTEYKETMGVRHEVAQLRTTLATTGAPLEDSQVKPLQRALVEAQQRQVEEWNRTRGNMQAAVSSPPSGDPLAWQEQALRSQRKQYELLRESLKSVLTDAQLRRVEQQHEAQLKLQEANLRMMRAQAAADAGGPYFMPANTAVATEAVMITNGAAYAEPVQ